MASESKLAPIRKGLLEFLVLKIVGAKSMYVPDILRALAGTEFATQEGTLYPLLSKLRREDLVDQIEASLARHQIPPGRLTCEITETVAMEDTTVTRQAFERLRRAGLHVSIDDFGTGHSSLASLRRLPAAELKIDRAFVTDLGSSEQARSIVRAIVQMAHSLQMRVVAEGVETEAQRDELVTLGCDELQGYLFAKPMSPLALALWSEGEGPAACSLFRASLFDPTAPAPLDS